MTLLERLRVETRPAHDRIERAVDIEGSTASIRRYRSLLERFYGFYASWEPAAEPAIADAAFFQPRRKLDLLHRDLRALGLGVADIAKLPRCALDPITNPAAAFGARLVTADVAARDGSPRHDPRRLASVLDEIFLQKR